MAETTPGTQVDPAQLNAALEGLFQSYEARVLAAIGLFIGYICVFFTKIMSFTQMYIGILGIAGVTFLLLLLNKDADFKSRAWWARSCVVVIFSLILTSPQFYFAWTVSVQEAQNAAQAAQIRAVNEAQAFVQPQITVAHP
jgi:hypothetical protein